MIKPCPCCSVACRPTVVQTTATELGQGFIKPHLMTFLCLMFIILQNPWFSQETKLFVETLPCHSKLLSASWHFRSGSIRPRTIPDTRITAVTGPHFCDRVMQRPHRSFGETYRDTVNTHSFTLFTQRCLPWSDVSEQKRSMKVTDLLRIFKGMLAITLLSDTPEMSSRMIRCNILINLVSKTISVYSAVWSVCFVLEMKMKLGSGMDRSWGCGWVSAWQI